MPRNPFMMLPLEFDSAWQEGRLLDGSVPSQVELPAFRHEEGLSSATHAGAELLAKDIEKVSVFFPGFRLFHEGDDVLYFEGTITVPGWRPSQLRLVLPVGWPAVMPRVYVWRPIRLRSCRRLRSLNSAGGHVDHCTLDPGPRNRVQLSVPRWRTGARVVWGLLRGVLWLYAFHRYTEAGVPIARSLEELDGLLEEK